MADYFMDQIDPTAVAMRLYRIDRNDDLIACQAMKFTNAPREAIDTVLRRAAISGRVEVNGEIQHHFADILDDDGDMVGTVALDAASYRALKTKWMRCRVERFE